MAATKITPKEFVEALKDWSILDVVEAVKAIEDEFGIKAAAPVAVAAVAMVSRKIRAKARKLAAHLLEKAVYELAYELNNRPDWVRIHLQGISQLLGAGAENA